MRIFHQVNPNGFVDPNLPSGYAPFGIRNYNGEIFVTYAKQDRKREDDVALCRLWVREVCSIPAATSSDG